ncbi:MAG: hypothetical protein K2N72_14400, partial [Oscillospiraceae bacterium]|nr:hypothetical protein [Oscillospiraceae bacterium]
ETSEKNVDSENSRKPVQTGREMPKEIEKRCQKVYNLLYKRIGKIMSEEEFKEWSKFLSDFKRDFRSGDAELEQIEDFLVYWETAVKKLSRRSGKSRAEKTEQFREALRREDITGGDIDEEGRLTEIDPAVRNVLKAAAFYGSVQDDEGAPTVKTRAARMRLEKNAPRGQDISENESGLSDMFDEVSREVDEKAEETARIIEGSEISPAGTENLPEERVLKPFNPPKYNTVLEAMMDGKYKSDELLGSDDEEEISEIRVNGKKVRLPDWERIPRE